MLTFIDLFCGAGGWTAGLKRAGLVHVVGVDLNASAIASYKANHGQDSALQMDVRALQNHHLEPFLQGRCLVGVFASPPCQTLSHIGARPVGDEDDDLYLEVLRIAKDSGARFVVIENVVGMLSKLKGDGSRVFDALLAALPQHGFTSVHWQVLRADNYLVPQTRRRVFVVGTRGEPLAPRLFPPPVAAASGEHVRTLLLSRDMIEPFYWMTAEKARYWQGRFDDPKTGRHVRFVDFDAIAATVRAGYGKSRGAEALVKYADGSMRMLTECECARIQSFPDDYAFVGCHRAVYEQIGNAVPPELAFHFGAAVARAMHLIQGCSQILAVRALARDPVAARKRRAPGYLPTPRDDPAGNKRKVPGEDSTVKKRKAPVACADSALNKLTVLRACALQDGVDVSGWRVEVKVRLTGVSCGKHDFYFHGPGGQTCRSCAEVLRACRLVKNHH